MSGRTTSTATRKITRSRSQATRSLTARPTRTRSARTSTGTARSAARSLLTGTGTKTKTVTARRVATKKVTATRSSKKGASLKTATRGLPIKKTDIKRKLKVIRGGQANASAIRTPKSTGIKKIRLVKHNVVQARIAMHSRGKKVPAATSTARTSESRPALLPGSASREQCLERYLPLVRYVVEKVAAGIPRHVDHEDLVSAGVLGLLNAYDKFDTGKGTKFETYAVWRIRGAVLDQLRSLDWASRSTRRMGREMETCARALDQKLGRTANDQEIAGAMKIKLEEYYRIVDRVRGSVLVSLDETRHGEEGDTLGLAELLEDPKTPDILATIEQEEIKSFLHVTLSRLPEQERIVMALYYYEQMTLREIGEALGISESRVSQIHTRAVERLRGRVHRALAS